jgi:sugar/nucleoside kinase (ribokinase family)
MGKLIGKSSDINGGHKKAFLSGSYDVICIGRPAQDTILSGDVFTPVCKHGECTENIPLGSKLNVQDLYVDHGGNALNAAVTLARQELDVALACQLGTDLLSQNIQKILQEEGISQELALAKEDVKIPQSTIIVAPSGERAILAYPGSVIDHQTILTSLDGVETRWLYLSSVGSLELLRGAINYAQLNQPRQPQLFLVVLNQNG